jgi:hypothetical protein
MNAPNTTPGPWTYDQTVCITGSEHLPCVVDAYGLVVAECQDDGHSEIECEANAHLIAAAPELYEALALLFEHGPVDIAFAGNPVACDALEAKCRAALAKARGEQS